MRPSRPTTVVLFMLDQLSAKWLEAACDGICRVPNVDRLRQMGMTFANAFTSNPVCMPTRATIATGMTTRGHGVLENGYQLDPRLPTFMRVLQENGWRTGAFGKLHFHPHFAGFHADYRQYGFDVTHITEDGRGGEWLDWVEECHPEHYEAALATIWATKIPEFEACGPRKINLRDRIEGIRRSFKWATPEHPANTPGYYTLPFPEEVSQTAWITGHALDFLRESPGDQRLFGQISYVQPHGPYCPPAEDLYSVEAAGVPEPLPPEWRTDPHAPAYFRDKTPREVADWRYMRQCYFADLVHLDRQLGRVLDALEETGRLATAAVILLADHGDLLLDHGFTGKEERHYDACIRVPLIVAAPGMEGGVACEETVQLEDICPTVLDLAGLGMPGMPKMGEYLKVPADGIPVLTGGSLLPLCRGETPPGWREAAYCESYNAIWSVDPGDWARTIRTRDFRYTFYPANGEQMFDLRGDPDEQHNIVAEPEYAEVRQRLRDRLIELIVMQDYPKTRRDLFALGVH